MVRFSIHLFGMYQALVFPAVLGHREAKPGAVCEEGWVRRGTQTRTHTCRCCRGWNTSEGREARSVTARLKDDVCAGEPGGEGWSSGTSAGRAPSTRLGVECKEGDEPCFQANFGEALGGMQLARVKCMSLELRQAVHARWMGSRVRSFRYKLMPKPGVKMR